MVYGGATRKLTQGLDDDLWLVSGILEVLAARVDLTPEARALTEAALVAAEQAVERIQAFEQPPRHPRVA
jgi:hypothetical protein